MSVMFVLSKLIWLVLDCKLCLLSNSSNLSLLLSSLTVCLSAMLRSQWPGNLILTSLAFSFPGNPSSLSSPGIPNSSLFFFRSQRQIVSCFVLGPQANPLPFHSSSSSLFHSRASQCLWAGFLFSLPFPSFPPLFCPVVYLVTCRRAFLVRGTPRAALVEPSSSHRFDRGLPFQGLHLSPKERMNSNNKTKRSLLCSFCVSSRV